MRVEIPIIYEEDIIEFTQQKGDLILKYYDDSKTFEIVFNYVYAFDFIEFEYISEEGWRFGLELQSNSIYIEKLISSMSKEKLQRFFEGDKKKLQHYKLVIDDVGMYNIVCKDIKMGYASM